MRRECSFAKSVAQMVLCDVCLYRGGNPSLGLGCRVEVRFLWTRLGQLLLGRRARREQAERDSVCEMRRDGMIVM